MNIWYQKLNIEVKQRKRFKAQDWLQKIILIKVKGFGQFSLGLKRKMVFIKFTYAYVHIVSNKN